MEIKPISKKAIIILSVFSIITGILFCCLGTDLLAILFTILGAFLVLGGIFCIFKLDVLGALLGIAVGALLIAGAWLFVEVLLIINGVLLCLSGIVGLADALRNEDGKKCVISILVIVLGVMFFITNVANWIFFIIGALFIVYGIFGIIASIFNKNNKDKTVKTVDVKDIKKED